jgi:hypothetical protein
MSLGFTMRYKPNVKTSDILKTSDVYKLLVNSTYLCERLLPNLKKTKDASQTYEVLQLLV